MTDTFTHVNDCPAKKRQQGVSDDGVVSGERPDEDNSGGRTAKWMVTFGDSLTLLLTFFVLIYTFSQPEPEAMYALTRMLAGARSPGGIRSAPQSQTNILGQRKLLLAAKTSSSGAEKPPLYGKLATDKSAQFPPDVEIKHLMEFGEVLSIRIPLERLFEDDGSTLSDGGRNVLKKVARIFALRPCTVIVNTRGGKGFQNGVEIATHTVPVMSYLRKASQTDFVSFRISPDVRMGGPRIAPGHCVVLILGD